MRRVTGALGLSLHRQRNPEHPSKRGIIIILYNLQLSELIDDEEIIVKAAATISMFRIMYDKQEAYIE